MLLDLLKDARKVAGMRTTLKAITDKKAAHAFVADDADVFITRRVTELCSELNIPYTRVSTMKELGDACGLQVGTACAALIK